MSTTESGRIEMALCEELRRAVLKTLEAESVTPDELAVRLDLVPTALKALLQRRTWPLHTALLIADGLDLSPIVHFGREVEPA